MSRSYTRRRRKTKIKYFVYLCCLLGIVFICHTILTTSMRYRSNVSAEVLGYAKEDRSTQYIIVFNANGGTGTMGSQTINYGDTENLTNNAFSNSDGVFFEWNTKADGTGTSYANKASIKITEPLENNTLNLYAQWGQGAVEVNGRYFDTVSQAIAANAIPTDNTETIVNVLDDISDKIIIAENMNVIMDLHGNTITNSANEAIITNNQQLTIRNGTITTQTTNTAAINNQSTGNIIIDGVTVKMEKSGGKQAFYNDKGIAEIKGDSYLYSVSTIRGTVQNVAGGTLKITSGTIVAPGYDAVVSAGAMTIGIKDGEVDEELVTIKGKGSGISASAKFNFYDGCVMGKSNAINNKNQLKETEEGRIMVYTERMVDNVKYFCAYLSDTNVVEFDPNKGTTSETARTMVPGTPIGTLPTCTRMGYIFDGWFTELEGGEQISEETIVTGATTFYAHWTAKQTAIVNDVIYPTIQEALDKVPNHTKTTITLINDTEEYITVSDKKDIVLDLQNHTISNYDNTHTIISNRGTIEILNGTIVSADTANAAVDNEKTGNMKISGLTVNVTGTRQALFNNGGIVEITGNTVLTASPSGVPTTTTLERATVQNLNAGTMTITGGIITAVTQHGISNDNSTLTIGIKGDGDIDNTAPIIIGNVYGINNAGVLNIYDGVIKGIDDSIFGDITELEDNTQRKDYTETIDDSTYKVTELEEIT